MQSSSNKYLKEVDKTSLNQLKAFGKAEKGVIQESKNRTYIFVLWTTERAFQSVNVTVFMLFGEGISRSKEMGKFVDGKPTTIWIGSVVKEPFMTCKM